MYIFRCVSHVVDLEKDKSMTSVNLSREDDVLFVYDG